MRSPWRGGRSSPTAFRRSPERPPAPVPPPGAPPRSGCAPSLQPASESASTAAGRAVHSRRSCIDPTNGRRSTTYPCAMASDDLDTLARLRGLLDVSRVVRDEESLPEVLNAIAGTIADSLGYKVVVVNLYRPAWDDFEVTTVRDYNQEAVATAARHPRRLERVGAAAGRPVQARRRLLRAGRGVRLAERHAVDHAGHPDQRRSQRLAPRGCAVRAADAKRRAPAGDPLRGRARVGAASRRRGAGGAGGAGRARGAGARERAGGQPVRTATAAPSSGCCWCRRV